MRKFLEMDDRAASDLLKQDIVAAIEIGSRVNGVDLLDIAARVLNGTLQPSPALAKWFRDAVDRIGDGESADIVFDTKRRQGTDPIKSYAQRLKIERLVNAALAAGYPTSVNRTNNETCFDVVGAAMHLSGKTVANQYYELQQQWDEVETWELPPRDLRARD